jgi:hypothetical protein
MFRRMYRDYFEGQIYVCVCSYIYRMYVLLYRSNISVDIMDSANRFTLYIRSSGTGVGKFCSRREIIEETRILYWTEGATYRMCYCIIDSCGTDLVVFDEFSYLIIEV